MRGLKLGKAMAGRQSVGRSSRRLPSSPRRTSRRLGLEALESRMVLSATPQLLLPLGSDAAGVPFELVPIGDVAYFVANDGVHGRELWKTDGTPQGTSMVTDIRAGDGGSNPRGLTALGGLLFFAADDGVNGEELWRTDGTAAGTVLVKDLHTGSHPLYQTANYSSPRDFVEFDGKLFFTAADHNGRELWRSDGTAAGTVMVRDIWPGTYAGYNFFGEYIGPLGHSSNPKNFKAAGGLLFFAADDGLNG
jgi:ELWxxDGT repeat protein